MPYLRPGETIRLGPPWTVGTTNWPLATGTWSLAMPGRGTAFGPEFPGYDAQGWTANVVAGTMGESDLVVDLTAPTPHAGTFNFNGSEFLRGFWSVPVTFTHGTNGSPSLSQRFGFTYDDLNSENTPEFDVAFNSALEIGYSAMPEQGGLQFYKWNLRDGMAAKTTLGLIETAVSPQLWLDSQNHLYCVALYQADVAVDDYTWKLWKSTDGGANFFYLSDLPFTVGTYGSYNQNPETGPRVRAGIGADGVMMAIRSSYTNVFDMDVTRSLDGGATWQAIDPLTLTVGFNQQRRIEQRPGSSEWYINRGGAATALLKSTDYGRSWAESGFVVLDAIDPNWPGALGYQYASIRTGANVIMLAGEISEFSAAAQPYPHLFDKLAFSRSHDWGRTWRPPTLITDDPGENLSHINQGQSTGTLFITNGRDRLYTSTNTGQTWEARP